MIRGIGVDIVEIERIKAAVEARKERFLARIFTVEERDYCFEKPRPFRHLAARFAAKEAVSKALGTGKSGMQWTDIEVCRDSHGRPFIKLYGGAADRAQEKGIVMWRSASLSIATTPWLPLSPWASGLRRTLSMSPAISFPLPKQTSSFCVNLYLCCWPRPTKCALLSKLPSTSRGSPSMN